MRSVHHLSGLMALLLFFSISTLLPAADWGLKQGPVELKSATSLTFGPDGVLFIGDSQAATIFAIETGDTTPKHSLEELNIPNIDRKLAEEFGISPEVPQIVDMAVNPISDTVYLSVQTKAGTSIVKVNPKGEFTILDLAKIAHAKVALPNPPEDKVVGEGRRKRNRRGDSITDLAFNDGKLLVSGLSNSASPSNVREIAFPFVGADAGYNVEIFHAAHGRVEDSSAVRTFVPFTIDGKPTLLAGFVCTPLVRFPLSNLEAGEKVRGATVAELGNRNRPLDMIVYKQDGESYLLLANSARGVMKISTENIGREEAITEPVRGGGVAGQTYKTIDELEGAVQLDKIDDDYGAVITKTETGYDLKAVKLP